LFSISRFILLFSSFIHISNLFYFISHILFLNKMGKMWIPPQILSKILEEQSINSLTIHGGIDWLLKTTWSISRKTSPNKWNFVRTSTQVYTLSMLSFFSHFLFT
jgi:hypothetical protein